MSIFDWFKKKENAMEIEKPQRSNDTSELVVVFREHQQEVKDFLVKNLPDDASYTIIDGFFQISVTSNGHLNNPLTYFNNRVPAICVHNDKTGELRLFAARTVLPNAKWVAKYDDL